MPAEIVAHLSGVTHRYGSVVALEAVDLEIRRGEVLAVLGPNGAGKTTAIHLLLGSLPVQTGKATVFGQRPDAPGVRARRGAMLQISGVPDTLTVSEHIDLFRAYYPTPLAAADLLAMAGIEGIEGRRFGKLSGGQKQRVMFALALCGDPQLVFLDEPTAGLDVEVRRGLWEEIRRHRESGRTTVLTTHYLEEADALADRIIVLHRGRVIAEGAPSTIKSRTAARRVRCVTRVKEDAVTSVPGVVRSETRGQHLEVLTSRPEALVRELFDRDPDLHDLTVVGAGLEEAFLALTRESDEPEPVR